MEEGDPAGEAVIVAAARQLALCLLLLGCEFDRRFQDLRLNRPVETQHHCAVRSDGEAFLIPIEDCFDLHDERTILFPALRALRIATLDMKGTTPSEPLAAAPG